MQRFFWGASDGQDMVEYALLLGFIAIAAAAVMIGMGGDVTTIWTVVNSRLSNASN